MNDMSPGDFGDNEDLLVALGLVNSSGDFESQWLSDPETYLKQILSNERQREALLGFVARAREGVVEKDNDGRQWVPLFEESFGNGASISFFIVVDDSPASEVHLSLGLRFTTKSPLAPSKSSVMLPLFRVGKGTTSVSPPELIGQDGGKVAVTTEVTVMETPPPPGEAGIRAIGLRVLVPTKPTDGDVDIELNLVGLQLPGESSGRDVSLSVLDAQDLQDEAINLLVSLIQAQMDGPGAAKLRAFAKMLGLGGDPAIPRLPLTGGLEGLGNWLAQTFGANAARTAWLQALADLFGNGAVVQNDAIVIPLGSASSAPKLTLGVRSEAGAAGRPVITVSASAGTTAPNVEAAFRADLLRIDLGTSDAVALPSLRADLRLDISGALPAGSDVSVDTLVVGFGLNGDRKPIFILELLNAQIFQTGYPRLDLTNPDALAAAGAQAASDALNTLLTQLGPAGNLIGVAMGIRRPTGAGTSYPIVDLLTFLGDPLGTLKAHWLDVLDNHGTEVTKALGDLRRLITGDATPNAVTGSGTDADPWRLPLEAGVYLAVWRDGAGRLLIGLGVGTSVDALGDRCTVIDTRLRVAIVGINLGTGQTGILPEIILRALARARGGGRLELGFGPVNLAVDHIGLAARWTPEDALTLRHEAPNPTASFDDVNIPLELPDLTGDFDDLITSLSDEQWEMIETLISRLVDALPERWLKEAVDALGWRREEVVTGEPNRHRLRLGHLVRDPQAEARRWLAGLLADPDTDIARQLRPLARLFSGQGNAEISVIGAGTVRDPWRLKLQGAPNLPALAVWRQPDTALPRPDARISRDLRRWRPGVPGLRPASLAAAIGSEFPELAGVFADARPGALLDEALPALAERWQGSDGMVAAPTGTVTGATIHISPNETSADILAGIDLSAIFGSAPATIIRVMALDAARDLPTGLDAARVLDMRDTARDARAYTALPAQSGTWHVFVPLSTATGGLASQVDRLEHALSGIASQTGATVLAAPGAGHAAWMALDGMGSGLNRLVAVGLPVTAPQVPAALSPAEGEILRRLAEFLPVPDVAEPDDLDLATARKLLAAHLQSAFGSADLALPSGWNTNHRADLDVHLAYGVMSQSRVHGAMTAMVAAGLSLHSQARDVMRTALDITSASFGLHVPLENAAPTGLQLKGHALAEVLGVDLDLSVPRANPRDARLISVAAELRDASGWLIGGPSAGAAPLDLELRSVEIELQTTIGGVANLKANRARLVLHGVRIHNLSYPRLELKTTSGGDLGIDGAMAPSAPEIVQLLETVFKRANAGSDPAIDRLIDALKFANILDDQANLDPISLANWLDDPAARLRQQLASSQAHSTLMALINDALGAVSGVSFNAISGTLSVSLSGSTGFAALDTWFVEATLSSSGVSNANLRLGSPSKTHISVALIPFVVTLGLSEDDAAAAGGLPRSLPLWPAPDAARMAKVLLPQMLATGLAEVLNGLRGIDANLTTVLDALFNALGLLKGPVSDRRVTVPMLMFIDPGAWLRQATPLGLAGGRLDPQKAIDLLEGLRPLVGLSGPRGTWNIAQGVALRLRASAPDLVVEVLVDESAFMSSADVDCGGSFGVAIGANGQVRPAIALFVGLAGNTGGRRAMHFTVTGNAVRLFLRDGTGSDLELYPTPANLSQFAMAGLQAALPMALDAIAATSTPAGTLVTNLGNALNVRPGGNFDGTAMMLWATDPVAQLQTNWASLTSAVLKELAPHLPSGISVSPSGTPTSLQISHSGVGVTITFNGAPAWVRLETTLSSLPVVDDITAAVRFDQNGLAELSGQIGPAVIPLGTVATLRPVAGIRVGDPDPAKDDKVYAGLAVDATATQVLEAAYVFDSGFEFRVGTSTDPATVASTLLRFVIDLLGGLVLELQPVKDLLSTSVGGANVRGLLSGVILTTDGSQLDGELFRFVRNAGESNADFNASKLARVYKLIDNIFSQNISVTIDNAVTLSLAKPGGVAGLGIGLTDRFTLVDGDVSLWLENDNRWIINPQPAGINVGLLKPTASGFDFAPVLSVDGVGLRVGGKNKPLLESPISIGSVALHLFARIDGSVSPPQLLGGAQVQIAELGVAIGGGGGEDNNPVAAGLLSETSDGGEGLAPAFSPALSVQSDVEETSPGSGVFVPTGGVAVDFRAGEGDGPWWLPIRQQFGPLYVGQIGIGRQKNGNSLRTISILFDGGVSIAGLSAAVDDLELKHTLNKGGLFEPASWSVDLAGLAVSADISGVSLSGGLRKFRDPPPSKNIEYIGMLNARFGTYGLSIFGGYAEVQETPSYTSFFAYGAILGPFGGPPAFFLTGIGGGFGINRKIVPPTNMDQFNTFTLITALDPAAASRPPMQALEQIRTEIQNERGTFWFAAGISFTSFALVDGIAVVVVEFGNGFELSIFGLARCALPRPEVALVSLELGLIARFSTSEGVIWIQAQLTENSWLLHPSARLTGGFAYVSWFKGDKAGEFVLTLGGYHPNFHRDGYPQVPRLGFNWSVSNNISIRSETYFALTSEAFMAGGLFEASAKFGAAFANLSFGGNALVYFDPFSYEADAHARISAGIRIKTFLGTIRLSFSLGAEIEVRGPEFNGTARIEVGPIDIRVRFGDSTVPHRLLGWEEFVEKYLELAPGDQAKALSGIAGKGALPPKSAGDSEADVPDGSSGKPYEMQSEFELAITTTIPFDRFQIGNRSSDTPTETVLKPNLDIAPSGVNIVQSNLILTLRRVGGGSTEHLKTAGIFVTARETGRFPKGVWGPTPDPDEKKVPKGEIIKAAEGIDIKVETQLGHRIPTKVPGVSFNRVESGDRKPLPLRAGGTARNQIVAEATQQRSLIAQLGAPEMAKVSEQWRMQEATPTAGRAWRRERVVPMRVGLLSERIVNSTRAGGKRVVRPPRKGVDTFTFGNARLRGMLNQKVWADESVVAAATKVLEGSALARDKPRMAPPRVNPNMAEWMSEAVLMRAQSAAPVVNKTLVSAGAAPETLAAAAPRSIARSRGDMVEQKALVAMEAAANGRGTRGDQMLKAGDVAVFDLPGSRQAVRFPTAGELSLGGGDARVIVLGAGGRVVANSLQTSRMKLPSGARSFAVLAGDAGGERDVAGWFDSSRVAYLGNQVARASSAIIRAEGASRSGGGKRASTGWMAARELTDQSSLIETQFDFDAGIVAVLLDGEATPDDLSALSVRIRGRSVSEERAPRLVPVSGKTLIIYETAKRTDEGPLCVTVAGRSDARLDGVMAARISVDALVARLLEGTLTLETDIAGRGAKPVSLRYRAPAAVRIPKEV